MKQRFSSPILCIALCFVLIFSLTTFAFSENIESQELIKLKTRSGVTQKLVLIKPTNPAATIVLIPGGVGKVGIGTTIGSKPTIKYKENFLIRTREEFAKQGLIVAVIDVPSDKSSKGMYLTWRLGQKHVQDMAEVVNYLKKEANIPVWVVGTSNGTFSTCNIAINSQGSVNGIVLTSSITNLEPYKKKVKVYKTHPNGILDMDLGKITVPALIVSHEDDKCPASPSSNSLEIKSKLVNSSKTGNLTFSGGTRPKSKPCKPLSPHGFYGIEDQVVTAIADFIKAN